MTLLLILPFAAGLSSLLIAAVSVLRKKPSPATWFFFAGMATLGLDSVLTGLGLRAIEPAEAISWLTAAFLVKSVIPVIWLCFSLTYSRTNYREFLARWRVPVAIVALAPIGLSIWWLRTGTMATALNAIMLVALVLILINLEQTFRSAVGTMRWRIKFVVLALLVIFGARLYVRSQVILFSAPDIALWSVESGALLIGCAFLALAYIRTGWAEIDVQPSSAVLRSSLTVVIVGGYLFVVGVLAQVVQRFGGVEYFQLQALVVLVGMAGLAVLLLSDRARQSIHAFSVRHFRKAQHDSVRIWTLFSRRLASVTDEASLCAASAKLICDTFDVLSVTVWLLDEETGQLIAGASTAQPRSPAAGGNIASPAVTAGLLTRSSPFDLEDVNEAWANELRQLNPTTFPNGGHRLCVPLRAGEQGLGALVLADRINGAVYSLEELELLRCLADQTTSVLLSIRLGSEVARAKELEAFRTMSAFFVHDLKNAAASLNLMLKNLPLHFDDPAFRQDALRGVGNTARRIDEMIERLSALRQRPESKPVKTDLNELVNDALARLDGMTNVQLTRDLRPLPAMMADPEQIRSVVTNLVLNARDAVGADGRIDVRTEHRGGRILLSVVDNGCGMSEAFVRDSLFRPFQSTKKKGLGIGLFQSRAIVHAHGGGMNVESEIGKGTTFLANFPVTEEP